MYRLLSNRRSIRKYRDKLVEEEKVDLLLRSMLRSPSGKSVNPWEIIYLDDKELVHQLATCKAHGAKFLSGAQQCLVVLADASKTDVWIEDASIMMTIGHLAATDQGLGSCWIQIRNRKTAEGESSESFVRSLLNVPESIQVEGILAFGYSGEDKNGHNEASLQKEKVYRNSYSRNFYL